MSALPSADPLLALGIVSAPTHVERRAQLRPFLTAGDAEKHNVLFKFVLGHTATDVIAEIKAYGRSEPDVVLLDASEGGGVGCVDKSFAWWRHAIVAYPHAAYIGKTDDDSIVRLPALAQLLRTPLPHAPRHVYAGWVQWTSWFPERKYFGCGWATEAHRALHARTAPRSDCARCSWCLRRERGTTAPARVPLSEPVVGPFPFATGALELMSAPLAAAVFGSAWAAEYISAARAAAQRELARDSLSEPHHTDGPNGTWYIPAFGRWQCQLEDATIGYAVHATAAALDATLLELNGLVVDVKNEWSDARRWGADALRRELGRYLVLHKYVGIEAELQRMEAKEDAENAHNLARGAIRRNITHLRDLASVRRRVRDALDAGDAAAAGGGPRPRLHVECSQGPPRWWPPPRTARLEMPESLARWRVCRALRAAGDASRDAQRAARLGGRAGAMFRARLAGDQDLAQQRGARVG